MIKWGKKKVRLGFRFGLRPDRRASSSTEYIALITFILTGFLIFQQYILRGAMGRWKSAGDAFGHGRQYDARLFGENGKGGGTLECFYDNESSLWVSARCFKAACNCTVPREAKEAYAACRACLLACSEANHEYAACGKGQD